MRKSSKKILKDQVECGTCNCGYFDQNDTSLTYKVLNEYGYKRSKIKFDGVPVLHRKQLDIICENCIEREMSA